MGKKYVTANGADIYTQKNSTEFQIANSTGLLYSQGKPIYMPDSTAFNPYYVETVVTGSSENPTLTPYGMTLVNALAGVNSSALTINLPSPITGVEKTVVVNSTAAIGAHLHMNLGTASIQFCSSDANFSYIKFSSAGQYQSITLKGMSTSKWAVLASESTVGNFGIGITATTIFTT
jgi:hypothetical protein